MYVKEIKNTRIENLYLYPSATNKDETPHIMNNK